MNVMSVGKPLAGAQILPSIKEFMLERSRTSAESAGKPSFIRRLLFSTRELTLQRDLLDVTNVGRALSAVHPSSDIKEFTLKSNPENLLTVKRCKLALSLCLIFEYLSGRSIIGPLGAFVYVSDFTRPVYKFEQQIMKTSGSRSQNFLFPVFQIPNILKILAIDLKFFISKISNTLFFFDSRNVWETIMMWFLVRAGPAGAFHFL